MRGEANTSGVNEKDLPLSKKLFQLQNDWLRYKQRRVFSSYPSKKRLAEHVYAILTTPNNTPILRLLIQLKTANQNDFNEAYDWHLSHNLWSNIFKSLWDKTLQLMRDHDTFKIEAPNENLTIPSSPIKIHRPAPLRFHASGRRNKQPLSHQAQVTGTSGGAEERLMQAFSTSLPSSAGGGSAEHPSCFTGRSKRSNQTPKHRQSSAADAILALDSDGFGTPPPSATGAVWEVRSPSGSPPAPVALSRGVGEKPASALTILHVPQLQQPRARAASKEVQELFGTALK